MRPSTTIPLDQALQRELIDAAIAVNEAPSLDQAFQVLAEAGTGLLGCDRIAVVLWDEALALGVVRADTVGDAVGAVITAHAPISREPYAGPPEPNRFASSLRGSMAAMTFVLRVPLVTESGIATFHAFWAESPDEADGALAADALQTLTRLTSLAERSAREREQIRAGSVLDGVADGVILTSGATVTLNAAARAILALPEDVEYRTSLFNPRTLDGEPYTFESDVPRTPEHSGERFRIRATALDGRELVLDGSIAAAGGGAVIVFRDVTDEHARSVLNERYLYALFNSMPIPLTVGNASTRELISANQAFLDLIGFDLDEIIGAGPPFAWWDPGEDASAGFSHGSVVRRVYRRKDGRPLPVEVLSHGIPGDDGEVRLLLGVITDLTEKQRLDQQLVQSGKLAAIGELAAGVAHEINNPLFAILGLTEFLLKEAEPGSRGQQRLELIQQTGLEIKEIVRALLDFARENAEERHVVPLDDVICSTVDLVRRTNAHKGVELFDEYRDGGALVNASPNQLKQIVLNLIANARQAMPVGGTVSVAVDRDGDHVVATVSDDGPGIEPAVLERIFEPFFTTKRPTGGTGLGLSVSLGIAEAHGGTLTASSEPGRGATFSLRLPVAEEVTT